MFKPKTTLALLCLLTSCMTLTLAQRFFPLLNNISTFADFLNQAQKIYNDPVVMQFRESIFNAKKSIVDRGNSYADRGLASFTMKLNILADLTHDEVLRLLGSKISLVGENITASHVNFVTAKNETNGLPDHVDWRELGGVTPPDFQGADCGSCWSFATAAALEGHLFRRTGILVSLSTQNLIDCANDYGNMGCDGGFQEYGFEYIRDHGISVAAKYPYTQMNGQCSRNEVTDRGVYIRDYARIKPGDEAKMKEVIATLGPLACSMNADVISFEQYHDGIYDDDACNMGEVNHSVVVVGYGTENGRDYWIIKNSYSANWGQNGFMKLPRNENSFCGIASECSYPIL